MPYESDLNAFAEDFREEILATAGVEEDESFRENTFTETVINALVDCGEIDDAFYCYYRSHGLQLNGFGVSSAGDSLYIFVSVCRWEVPPLTLRKGEVDSMFKRAISFFQKCCDGLHQKLEEASDVYDIAQQIHQTKDTISAIRFFLLSDCIAEQSIDLDAEIPGIACTFELWDMVRLHRLWTSGRERETIEVNFTELYGKPLECMSIAADNSPYQSFLCAFPAELLVKIYEKYGPRLLEKNVRTFLQLRGKVNKGIRETILEEPEMFLAYNNGICIVAENTITTGEKGNTAIVKMKDFQIVNGAQTVASLYNAYLKDKADISAIRVVGKVTAVSNEAAMDDLVPKISEFSNSQNKISIADFSANSPFHRKLEELSRTIWAPAAEGAQRQTRWFYERARGQYLDDKSRERTPAKKRVFESMNPSRQKFTKTDLGKFENTWAQLPYLVSRGAQKNFQEFMVRLSENSSYVPDEDYFHRLIAKAILFRQAEGIIHRQQYGGYRANIVTYSLAWLVRKSQMRIDLENIWREQSLTPLLEDSIVRVSKAAFDHITNPPGGANITEWCKKPECWELFRDKEIELSANFEEELIDLRPGSGDHIDLSKDSLTKNDLENIDAIMKIPRESWLALSLWAKQTRNLQAWQRGLVYSIGKHYVGKNKMPSKKQAAQALKAMDEAKRLGFNPDNPPEANFV